MTPRLMPEMLTYDDVRWARLTRVIEPLKIAYMGVPKSACTSLMWLAAELAGEDLDRFYTGLTLTPMPSSELAIHQYQLFERARTIVEIEPEVRRTIGPDNGWFVFATVRDPHARLFSAWQNKMLLHDPAYRMWSTADWYPQAPETADDVVRDFARFVELLRTERGHPLAKDPHFSDQVGFLHRDVVPYTRIYDVTEMSTLLSDLGTHLQAQGVERDLTLRRANETVLHANGRALPPPVRSKIEAYHAADFESFGHLWDVERIQRAGEWTTDSLREVGARIQLHERIAGLVEVAREQQQDVQRLTQRLERSEQTLTDLRQRAKHQRERLRQRVKSAEARARELESMRSTQVGLAARRLRRLAQGG